LNNKDDYVYFRTISFVRKIVE